ncbi:MAG: hypothetical protein GEU74_12830 [Nitriliruptorales bacterium]|nr:hypothetical protein [Nitriliruptorales bacterium]
MAVPAPAHVDGFPQPAVGAAELGVELRDVGPWHASHPRDAVTPALRRRDGRVTAVNLALRDVTLDGDLDVPGSARGVVLFAHGSGSSRRSPRNREVAGTLHARGFATLLMDLLTAEEEDVDRDTAALRFDIPMLAGRLVGAVDWLAERGESSALSVGTFGASTGAAAALIAAAQRPQRVRAVVSRGGRPDLAGDALAEVTAPTLLIVGELDHVVVDLNRAAVRDLPGETQLQIVPGATHLFSEPGALEQVSVLAGEWFTRHLGRDAD